MSYLPAVWGGLKIGQKLRYKRTGEVVEVLEEYEPVGSTPWYTYLVRMESGSVFRAELICDEVEKIGLSTRNYPDTCQCGHPAKIGFARTECTNKQCVHFIDSNT